MRAETDRVLVPPSTGWVEWGDTVYPAVLPDGPPLVLRGGSLVWTALVEGGTVADVVRRVAEAADRPEAEVAPGVEQLVDGLVAAGVLELRPSAD